ncbi:(R)-specific enoyl-CoA hydratase [Fusobacterium sp. DD29]|uniref:MaoC family dehydratase n=1 Tax=unclassified Fusobacterium TaxID=2648384 RepID=UPI001B8B2B26|nr:MULTISPECIES: MaoC family dehydratase [unclassified Fusobacterium]MBR8701143.1 (R)-specific enoyl-CoA hydratase [Fusobacterium sp. DD45]MBR8710921.1 (R)-specific enoyl-CoA hydratase [Fusobacterium sp. DD28]MBR8749385.1 (R)-specific enoyl-CoA hydratase [Fusobacterium sp. DD29]MBR8751495.1 (R)-specific enoyl-CoA hydratase [Fusobacterium sp. DD26]MBR8761652.1 (R)-specific enoyl-CoA hydratase [Fusobacterium sp. DD25]
MRFEELELGMKATVTKTITEGDVTLYAGLTLDINPAHLNEEYAKTTMFKHRIAHGMLTAGLVSAVLGTKLPGEGSIYMGQEMMFTAPVYFGDTITATAEIIELIPEKNRVILSTICTNQEGKVVLKGQAKIMKK